MLQYFAAHLRIPVPYRMLKREEGQDLAEYALLLVFIALIVLGAVALLGQGIGDVLTQLGDELGNIVG